MLKNADAETLMQDARKIHAEATRMVNAGDWRNASEKAWHAVEAATAALIWDLTGVENHAEADISAGIRKLAYQRGGEYIELRIMNGDFAHNLFFRAFHDGNYHEDIPDLIGEVADYIARAEQLAETGA